MSVTVLYGFLAWALLAGVGVGTIGLQPGGRRLPLAAGVAALALVPLFAGESLAMGLHGALAAPSLTLVQLALWRLLAPRRPTPLNGRAAGCMAGLGLVFYPLALGWGSWDPYALGYQPLSLLLALMPLAAWLVWRRRQDWLLILALDLFAYAVGLFGNLWDALLDPILVLLAFIALAKGLKRRRPAA